MNQARQIFKNTAVLGAARLIDRAGNIILAFFVARILHAPGLGDYATALVIHELVTLSSQMGSSNLLIREIGKSHENTNRYFVHLTVMTAGLAALGMILFAVALPHLGFSSTITDVLRVVLFAFIPGTLIALEESVFVAHQRTEFVTYTTSIAAALNIAVSLFLLLTGNGVVSLVVAFVVTQWTVMFCELFFIQRYIVPLRWELDLKFARSLAGEIKTFAAISIVAAFFSRPEVIILSLVSTEAQIGFYSAALKIVGVLQYIPQIYMTNVFPVLARAYHLADRRTLDIQNQSIKYLLAISLPMTVGLIVAAEPLINLLYGPGFEPSVIALRVLAFYVPLTALFAVLWRVLVARHEQDSVLRVMILVTFGELVGGYFLISGWDSLGAAVISTVISLFSVILLTLSMKQDRIQLLYFRLGWRFALAAVGMGLVLIPLRGALGLWGLLTLGVISYLIFVILLRAFSREDLDLFRTVLPIRNASK
jgi:O-antigen/teichoic acid export membrane protein